MGLQLELAQNPLTNTTFRDHLGWFSVVAIHQAYIVGTVALKLMYTAKYPIIIMLGTISSLFFCFSQTWHLLKAANI